MKVFLRHWQIEIYNRFKWLLFPHRCMWCNEVVEYGTLTCENCKDKIKFIGNDICRICGRDIENCSCHGEKYYFSRSASCFYYEKEGAKGILNLKLSYPENRRVKAFSDILEKRVRKVYDGIDFDLICSVPIHKSKLWKKGFNQSALLATEISKSLNVDFYSDLLIKTKNTKGQHELSQKERKKNLKNSFKVNEKYKINGYRILLVDDVITTGSTLNECSKMLLKSGADFVYCITLAATNLNKEE